MTVTNAVSWKTRHPVQEERGLLRCHREREPSCKLHPSPRRIVVDLHTDKLERKRRPLRDPRRSQATYAACQS